MCTQQICIEYATVIKIQSLECFNCCNEEAADLNSFTVHQHFLIGNIYLHIVLYTILNTAIFYSNVYPGTMHLNKANREDLARGAIKIVKKLTLTVRYI